MVIDADVSTFTGREWHWQHMNRTLYSSIVLKVLHKFVCVVYFLVSKTGKDLFINDPENV